MSLLFLKTKDLTWQDHTLNIEAMLAPTRSQLLVNKHKSYDARAYTDKDLYEKQKATRLKDYVIEKRMMERRREKINKRKRDILMQRTRSANSQPPSLDIEDAETKSNHSDSQVLKRRASTMSSGLMGSSKCPPLPPAHRASSLQTLNTQDIEITCQNRGKGIFVTEYLKDNQQFLPDVHDKHKTSKHDTKYVNDRNVSFTTDSHSRCHRHSKSKLVDDNGHFKPLDVRIQEFLLEQQHFNSDSGLTSPTRAWDMIDHRKKPKPLVACKHTNMTLDRVQLEQAFDQFCSNNSKESLQKIVKMAAKLRAKVTIARNQSWVPSIATIKFSKVFVDSLKSDKLIPVK